MKGVIFTEFLDFVDARLGAQLAETIIADANPPHGGAYTAVGTYPFTEMAALLGALSRRTGRNREELLLSFGQFLGQSLARRYPAFFESHDNLFDFLASIHDQVHVEVRKLYPDAELPSFCLSSRGPGWVDFDYQSCRALEHLAEGLISAAAAYYDETITIQTSHQSEPDRQFVRFFISRVARELAA